MGFRADIPNAVQNARDRGAGFKSACRGKLVYDAVCEGIGKGDAEFQDVDACRFEGQRQGAGGFETGIACADVGYQCLSTLGLEGPEFLVDAVGHGVGDSGGICENAQDFLGVIRSRKTRLARGSGDPRVRAV